MLEKVGKRKQPVMSSEVQAMEQTWEVMQYVRGSQQPEENLTEISTRTGIPQNQKSQWPNKFVAKWLTSVVREMQI